MKNLKLDKKSVLNFLSNNAITLLLLVLVMYCGFTVKNYFSFQNFSNVMSNVTPRFIIALGISGALIIKGTDLSAGRAIGLAGVLSCVLLQKQDYANRLYDLPDMNIWVVLLIVIAVSVMFAVIDGSIIAFLKVPPFLSTLGMKTIIYGINEVFSDNQPVGGLKTEYTDITTKNLFAIGGFKFKFLFIFAILVGLLFWFLYNKTRYGKYMYAIGGNENAAEVSGINVNKQIILIYALAGAMYGLGGFLLGGKAGGASTGLGDGYELEAIASCTIGGVSTTGGVGKVSGILLGVLVFELLKTSMQYLGISPYYQEIARGIVIIIAVAIDIRKYTGKK